MAKLALQDLDLEGKRVLMRVDFNVPLQADRTIADLTRIKESLPSIRWILEKGGSVILMSHLGKPQGKPDPRFSLAPCAEALGQLLHRPVFIATECVGAEVKQQASLLKKGEILLLENLRFHAAEENPKQDPSFAKELASLGDIYVNDAFASSHRKHASLWDVPALFPHKAAAGFLLQKEIHFLDKLLSHPQQPFYALVGGAKVSSKAPLLRALLPKIEGIFLGGAMAFTFFKAQNLQVGDSLYEPDCLSIATEFMQLCRQRGVPLWLPSDAVIADECTERARTQVVPIAQGIPAGWRGVDIGPETCRQWDLLLKKARTLFWNGPLGICECPPFAKGTQHIAQTLSTLAITTVVGGGDSLAAIHQAGLDSHFTHLSTGGGATLEYIEEGHLPGIDALSNKD